MSGGSGNSGWTATPDDFFLDKLKRYMADYPLLPLAVRGFKFRLERDPWAVARELRDENGSVGEWVAEFTPDFGSIPTVYVTFEWGGREITLTDLALEDS